YVGSPAVIPRTSESAPITTMGRTTYPFRGRKERPVPPRFEKQSHATRGGSREARTQQARIGGPKRGGRGDRSNRTLRTVHGGSRSLLGQRELGRRLVGERSQ